jgi:hypothetical protein
MHINFTISAMESQKDNRWDYIRNPFNFGLGDLTPCYSPLHSKVFSVL